MRRDIGRWRALANAGFALAVLALGGFGLYQVASRRWQVQPNLLRSSGIRDDCWSGGWSPGPVPGD